jgi:hypothetical protein
LITVSGEVIYNTIFRRAVCSPMMEICCVLWWRALRVSTRGGATMWTIFSPTSKR